MFADVCLVTGAGRGIGRACALALASEGVALALTSRTGEELEETAAAAREAGTSEVLVHPADMADASALDELVAAVGERWGRLDLLVQNAGLFEATPLGDLTDEAWDRMIAVNLTGPFRLLRRALPLLRASERAHVIHVLSAVVRDTFPGTSAYTASKRGLQGFSAVIREELREAAVRVTDVFPGAVDTAAWDSLEGDFDRSKMLRPDDVARAVVHAWRDGEDALTEEIWLKPKGGNV